MDAKMRSRYVLMAGLLLALLASALTGCQAITARSERVETGWSRGEKLGQAALNNQVGMVVAPRGDRVSLVWVGEDSALGLGKLHFAQLDGAGHTQIDQDLAIETTNPEQVQVLPGQGDALHLLWIDGSRSARQLFHIQLDAAGALLASPAALSLPGASVSSYAVERDQGGQLDVFWASLEGQHVGLYHILISVDGRTGAPSQPVSSGGFDPALRIDSEGRLHAVWYEEPKFNEYTLRYAIYDAARNPLGSAIDLASFPTGLGLTAHRPALGLTTTDAYVFWSLERRGGGRTEPMAESYWLSFPLGHADRAGKPQYVSVPPVNHPAHTVALGEFDTGNWAPAAQETLPSTFVYLPSPARGQREMLPVAFSVQLEGRTVSIIQPVLTLWADGAMRGYQLAARTRNPSLRPVLLADETNLHLAWIDTAGFGKYDVYYASSAPSVRANLDRVMFVDLVTAAMNLAWGVAQAISFLPIVFVWAFLPLLVVSVYALIRAEDDMARPGPRVALIVAVILYAAFKYLFRPTWLASFPLPRGAPQNIAAIIVYSAPLVISGLAGLATWLYVKKRESASLFPTLAVFVGTDVMLTLLIYVPSILAE